MEWQDLVLSVGSLLFILALLPTVFSEDKPAKTTSALTGSVLLVFAATYLTLDLHYTAATTLITAALWLVILFQTIYRKTP